MEITKSTKKKQTPLYKPVYLTDEHTNMQQIIAIFNNLHPLLRFFLLLNVILSGIIITLIIIIK